MKNKTFLFKRKERILIQNKKSLKTIIMKHLKKGKFKNYKKSTLFKYIK